MDNTDEQRGAQENLLPVHTLEDLSRADLGSAHVVRMVVNDEMANRAEELQQRGAAGGGGGRGGSETTPGAGGEGSNPFGDQQTRREE